MGCNNTQQEVKLFAARLQVFLSFTEIERIRPFVPQKVGIGERAVSELLVIFDNLFLFLPCTQVGNEHSLDQSMT